MDDVHSGEDRLKEKYGGIDAEAECNNGSWIKHMTWESGKEELSEKADNKMAVERNKANGKKTHELR